MPLNILFWNCNCAFRKKYSIVQQYDADVCIIAECENPGMILPILITNIFGSAIINQKD